MRACATATAVFFALVSATLGFAACSSGSTPPQPPPGPDAVPTPSSHTTNIAPLPLAPPPDPAKVKATPKTAADCKVIMSEITNEPPAGGVALNNAMTAKDAGGTDRLEPLTELIRSKRDGFRCCFDVWAKDHRGAVGKVKMVLKLKPDGSVLGVDFEDTESRVPEVEACIGDLARGLSYPRSPSGKETRFRYPFDFKAR